MVFFYSNQSQNVWICAYSILLLNYNCGITSYIIYFKNSVEDIDTSTYVFVTLSLLVGLVVGQLIFGIFGDIFGRKHSFVGCASLMVIGSILSIFAGDLQLSENDLVEFGLLRFIMGVGAGGLYPLVAAITRESSQEDFANSTIAYVFGPVGSMGLILAPLIVYILSLTGVDDNLKWRILLIVGAIATSVLLFLNIEETLDKPRNDLTDSNQWFLSLELFVNQVTVGFNSASFTPYLLGTSISWFFSDILHYGNILCQVKLVDNIIATDSYDDDYYNFSLSSLALIGVISSILFWIGGLFSMVALKHLSVLALQLHGFTLSMTAFFLAAICKVILPKSWWVITILFYSCTYLFNGFGPAPTTFIMPSLLFPPSIRSTANGIAAAIGKLGAVVGILIIGYVELSASNILAFFGAIAMLGIASTLYTIRAHISANSIQYMGSSSSASHKNSNGSVFSSPHMLANNNGSNGYGTRNYPSIKSKSGNLSYDGLSNTIADDIYEKNASYHQQGGGNSVYQYSNNNNNNNTHHHVHTTITDAKFYYDSTEESETKESSSLIKNSN